MTPLMLACQQGNISLIRRLLDLGAKVNDIDCDSNWSAINYSIANNNHQASAILLRQPGINLKLVDTYHQNLMHILAYTDDLATAQLVQSYHLCCHCLCLARDKDGSLPIDLACSDGMKQWLSALLHIDVNTGPDNLETQGEEEEDGLMTTP